MSKCSLHNGVSALAGFCPDSRTWFWLLIGHPRGSVFGSLEKLVCHAICREMFFDIVDAVRGNRVIAVLAVRNVFSVAQVPKRERQMLSGKTHDFLENKNRHSGVIFVVSPGVVQQTQNADTAIHFAVNSYGKLTHLEYRIRFF